MLGSEETPEHIDHTPEGDYYSSNNYSLPSPQFQLSPRHSSTSFRFCHHFQTLRILPTTVLKEIKIIYRYLARFLRSNAWDTSGPHSKEE